MTTSVLRCIVLEHLCRVKKELKFNFQQLNIEVLTFANHKIRHHQNNGMTGINVIAADGFLARYWQSP